MNLDPSSHVHDAWLLVANDLPLPLAYRFPPGAHDRYRLPPVLPVLRLALHSVPGRNLRSSYHRDRGTLLRTRHRWSTRWPLLDPLHHERTPLSRDYCSLPLKVK